MSTSICIKCKGLSDGAQLCTRCHAMDELLASSDVLHDQVRRALRGNSPGERVLAHSALVRHRAAVERVRALR